MKFEVNNACFAYDREEGILKDVCLQACEGEVISILGPNGAGKTTLLKCMLGFRKLSSGEILIDGKNALKMPENEFWKLCAYVPQARVQTFPYTVRETVLMGRSVYLGMFETPGEKDLKIAEEAMKTAGILHLADRSCSMISGGELQLTLIARALAQQPKILVLDEPETGLDFRNQLLVLQMIDKLAHENGLTVIFNTHYPEHAVSVSDKTLLLHKRGDAVFGKTADILTEDTMRQAFGVNIVMKTLEIEGKPYASVIPVSLIGKRSE